MATKTTTKEKPLRLQKHTFLNPPPLKGQELLKNVLLQNILNEKHKEMYNSQYNKKENTEKRKALRTNSTSEEAVLWRALKGCKINNRKWRRQFSVGPFILDFYCPSLKLGIELDGAPHFAPGAAEADDARTYYLREQGIRIIRFENCDIWNSFEGVIETIQKETM